jgi:hypothetical protein
MDRTLHSASDASAHSTNDGQSAILDSSAHSALSSSPASSSRGESADRSNVRSTSSEVSFTHFKQKLVSVPAIFFGLRLPGSIMTVLRSHTPLARSIAPDLTRTILPSTVNVNITLQASL